ncbi:MAG: hypothetical protein JNK58_02015 [Phycisphaerae bacterium]|nr:hypothetical protein [Phycisphaerae bacterium]
MERNGLRHKTDRDNRRNAGQPSAIGKRGAEFLDQQLDEHPALGAAIARSPSCSRTT